MKEFEAKKQKIIIHIEELQRCDRLQEKVNSTSLAKNVKELQPPRPTFATCEYMNDLGYSKKLYCTNEQVKKVTNCLGTVGINRHQLDDFGCIHHSLYGATNG